LNIYIFYSSNNDLFMSWINFKRYCSLTFVWFFKTKIQVIKVFLVKLDFKFLITSYINTKSNKSISTFFIEKFPWNPHSSIIIFFFFILSCIFHKSILEKMRMILFFCRFYINKTLWITTYISCLCNTSWLWVFINLTIN